MATVSGSSAMGFNCRVATGHSLLYYVALARVTVDQKLSHSDADKNQARID